MGSPQILFNMQIWILFYTRANDFLKALDIDPEEDKAQRGWSQIKMMFEGDEQPALQTMLDNNTIAA